MVFRYFSFCALSVAPVGDWVLVPVLIVLLTSKCLPRPHYFCSKGLMIFQIGKDRLLYVYNFLLSLEHGVFQVHRFMF